MGQRGKDFTIDGRTTSLTGVSDFVANLEASAWFKRPVELLDSQVDQTPAGATGALHAPGDDGEPRGAAAAGRPRGAGRRRRGRRFESQ